MNKYIKYKLYREFSLKIWKEYLTKNIDFSKFAEPLIKKHYDLLYMKNLIDRMAIKQPTHKEIISEIFNLEPLPESAAKHYIYHKKHNKKN